MASKAYRLVFGNNGRTINYASAELRDRRAQQVADDTGAKVLLESRESGDWWLDGVVHPGGKAEPIGVGDFVRTVPFGLRGRVYEVHDRCPEDRDWQRQQWYLRPEQLDEPWVSVLTDPDGAISAPVSNCMKIEPFVMNSNTSYDKYFTE